MASKLPYTIMKLLPKKYLSSLVGKFALSKASRAMIPLYIRKFKIDPTLAEKKISEYQSLTEFFTRRLRPGLRPIDPSETTVISPVDGIASELGPIHQGTLLQAKGVTYTVESLLGSQEQAALFEGGTWVTLYLSPKDYHRIHAPVAGYVYRTSYIPGALWPVNDIGVQHVPGLFSKNERIISYLRTSFGNLAVVKVGATIVGSIKVGYDDSLGTNKKGGNPHHREISPAYPLEKGGELGVFEFGSTVILLFPRHTVLLDPDLIPGKFVKMGERIGTLLYSQEVPPRV